ncbi:MAG TPA: hypothetical protein VGN57_02230 [Pirellulaceae bacterium]|jgi:malonyl CoA-acyl carrier protein transacylase|nr:hypothetical protein [Pirellulaceae bacterium]
MPRSFARPAGICLVMLAGLTFANRAGAEGYILGETKEALKLDYDVAATDHGTGRVTVVLTIADEGRLEPLDEVQFHVPNQDGTNYVDLSVSLAIRDVDGKRQVAVHGLKETVERAELHLTSRRMDGKAEELTFYVHPIPLAPYFDSPPKKAE